MRSALVEMFGHNHWANLALFDLCAAQSEKTLNATVHGTYGSIRDTLVHITAAEQYYAMRLRGEDNLNRLRESDPFPGYEALREHFDRSGQALIEIAEGYHPGQILRWTRYGEESVYAAETLLIQAINHGNEHRSQIMTILTQQGVHPPDFDGWTYGERAQRAAVS